MGLMGILGGLGQAAGDIGGFLDQNAEQRHLEKVMAANPTYGMQLYGAKAGLEDQMFRQRQEREQMKQRDALRAIAPKFRSGMNTQDALAEYAGITGDISPLMRIADAQDTANIREFNLSQSNPEFAKYMQGRHERKLSGTEAIVQQVMKETGASFTEALAFVQKAAREGMILQPRGGLGGLSELTQTAPQSPKGYAQDLPLDNSPEAISNALGVPIDEIIRAQSDVSNVSPMITEQPSLPTEVQSLAGYDDLQVQRATQKTTAETQAKADVELATAPKIAADTENAKLKAKYNEEGRQFLPKAQRALQDAEVHQKNIARVADQARIAAKKAFTTGFTGSIASAVSGSPAFDLKSNLETLQANAAFDTLQNMRNNSPNGSALGAITEREIDLLIAAYSNLSNSQSYDQFIQNLDSFNEQNISSLENARAAYEQDYKRFGGEKDPYLPAPSTVQPNVVNWEDLP